MDNYEDEDMNLIILTDEEGNDIRFEYLDTIEFDGETYVVLIPVDIQDEDTSVVILKVDDTEGDQQNFTGVDDTEILDNVFGIFKEKFKDTFNFDDDDDF